MLIREMSLDDIPAVLPLYISYYNEQEDGCWNEHTAAKRIHQVLGMEDSHGLIVENTNNYSPVSTTGNFSSCGMCPGVYRR